MDDIENQIEQLRINRSHRNKEADAAAYDEAIYDNDYSESEGDSESRKGIPKKTDGAGGVITFQLILVLIIVIAYVLLLTFAKPAGVDLIDLIQDKAENDFTFRDKLYDSVGTFLTYLNEQRPMLDESTTDVSGAGESTLDTSVNESPEEAAAQKGGALDAEEEAEPGSSEATEAAGAGGEFTPVRDNEVPANATLANVIVTGEMTFPLKEAYRLSSSFGFREHPSTGLAEFHTAADLATQKDAAIYAVAGGTIAQSDKNKSLGNYVLIDHGNEFYTIYGHCDKRLVQAGDKVSEGDKIALAGSTGDSTGYHLHFGMKKNGLYFDPAYAFNELKGTSEND